LQLIKVSSIKEIRVLSQIKPEGFKPYEPRPLTVDAIKAREEAAAKRVVEEEKRLGVGVSLDGQRIYDAFAKTYRPTFFGDSFGGVVFAGGKLTSWG
jgi:hypothetical protein